MKLLILNGFDRSGTSLIGGLLGRHPDVTYLFQPFSGTEVHRSQYRVWSPDHAAPRTEAFLRGLLAGHVDEGYIASDWFHRCSTATAPSARGLNVIKDTKLHFKVRWLRERLPEIAFLGIWRDPRGVVGSLVRNGYDGTWYDERALRATQRVVLREPLLEPLRPLLRRRLTNPQKTALIVAARTLYMARHLGPDEWIRYEDVLADADATLGGVTAAFGLAPHRFHDHVGEDFNVSGKPFERADLWRELFSPAEQADLDDVFEPLAPWAPGAGGPREVLAGSVLRETPTGRDERFGV